MTNPDQFSSPFGIIPVAMAIPVYVSPEVEIEVGRLVFQHFVQEEFEHEHEQLPDELLVDEESGENVANGFVDENFATAQGILQEQMPRTPEVCQSILKITGANIREYANEFARSKQRNQVQREADQVDLAAITADSFWVLLDEVFRDGISQANFVALLYFCSDVLIRCVRQKLKQLGINLFKWAINYISRKVCAWVHKLGGWQYVCQKAVVNRYTVAAVVVVATALLLGIGWRK